MKFNQIEKKLRGLSDVEKSIVRGHIMFGMSVEFIIKRINERRSYTFDQDMAYFKAAAQYETDVLSTLFHREIK